jgi:trimeric autotransporter adhesin
MNARRCRRPTCVGAPGIVAIGLVGLLSLALAPRSAMAVPDDNWDARFFENGSDAVVRAIVSSGTTVYVGGDFTRMFGVAASGLARWDGASWTGVGGGLAGGAVLAIAVSGNDVYVGGEFSSAGGTPASRIAKWNGTSWSTLGSGMDGRVRTIAVSGSDVYVGGDFSNAGGTPASRIAKWNGTSWSALGSGMSGGISHPALWIVLGIAVSGTDVYAGGEFTTAGGVPARCIAKWDGTSWSGLGSGMNGVGGFARVHALATLGADVYAGGNFNSAGGVGTNGIAKWNGTAWSGLGGGLSAGALVTSVAASGTDVYAGGTLTTPGGTPANNVARWNGSAWSALDIGVQGTGGFGESPVLALAVSGADLYAGGNLIQAGAVGVGRVARWDGVSWSTAASTIGQGVVAAGLGQGDPHVAAFARSGSDLYAAGTFMSAGSAAATGVARWDGAGWSPLGSGVSIDCGGICKRVAALTTLGADVYAGGAFFIAGGVTVNHVARWNGTSWSALGTGMGGAFGGTDVRALAVVGGDLYAGGSFTSAGGVSASNIAKWDGIAWTPLGSGTNNLVYALTVVGTDLYVGGEFTTAGGVIVNRIAKWDGATWSALGAGMNAYVSALAASGPDLYAGGGFTTAGGTSALRIAKWNGTTWSALGTGMTHPFVTPGVGALAVVGSDLYAGGFFSSAGGVPASRIAKWNGVGWSALGSGITDPSNINFSVRSLATAGADVYVGGYFPAVGGGKPAAGITLWHNCGNGVVDPAEQCDDGATVNGDCCSSTCQFETGGGPCADDGNPCTNDQCDGAGGCAHPNNSAPCNDNVFCNGADLCGGGTCSQHPGDPCPGPDLDGDCAESCDETNDLCTGNDPNGSACNDSEFCNGPDLCSGGTCTVHTGDPCPGSDADSDCSESCDEALDDCNADDGDGAACIDGVFCNGADTCSAGSCDDHAGNPCIGGPACADNCNEALVTCNEPAGTPCDDTLFCNGADTCNGGACTHVGDPCAGNPECNDACNEALDSCAEPAATPCTADASVCTLDQCDGAGACAHPAGNAGVICRSAAGQCDVGETCTGAGVTCPADALQPDGTSCTDGDACTTAETCTAGACGAGSTTVCQLCEICDTVGGCLEAPRTGCKHPTQPLKAQILLQDRTPDDIDQVKWKWSNGQATTFAELGSPLTTDDYALCVYDASSNLLFRMTASASGTCGTKPCWKQLGSALVPKGYKYKDADGLPHDLDGLGLKAGLEGKAKMSVKGKGMNIPMPPLTFALPLTTQLQSENGTCFEATFTSAGVKSFTSTQFSAKGE